MTTRKKHLPLNWVDGMKISKSEFIQLENYLLDQICDSNALLLNDHNFGLLPSPEPGRDSVSLDVSSERVEVHHCHAVTRSGLRIEVSDMDIPGLRQATQQLTGGNDFTRTADWYVMVKVDPFQRLPYGKPAPESHPMRHLNSVPSYSLEIVPREQVQSPQFAAWGVPVAKIRSGYAGVEQVKNYIPPYSSVSASIELNRIHKRWEDELQNIERCAINIIRKVMRKKETEKSNTLAEDIYLFSWCVTEFIAEHYDSYRLLVPQQPPVHLVEFFMRLARKSRTALKLTSNMNGLMEYFQLYIEGFTPATFTGSIEGLCSVVYQHFEIRESTDRVDAFLSNLRTLFQRLEDLDYEKLAKFDPIRGIYHGQRDAPAPRQPERAAPPAGMVIKPKGEAPKGPVGGEDDWFR